MSLFVLSCKDGWVSIMYDGLDAVGVDQQVKRDTQKHSVGEREREEQRMNMREAHKSFSRFILYLFCFVSVFGTFDLVCLNERENISAERWGGVRREERQMDK